MQRIKDLTIDDSLNVSNTTNSYIINASTISTDTLTTDIVTATNACLTDVTRESQRNV